MKEKVAVFTEKCECSDLFTIAENKYRTEVSLYKDKKIVQEAGLEPARYCYHRHLKPARLPIPPFLHFPLFQQLFAAHNEYITSFFSGSQHFFLFFFTITSFVLFQIYEALILWLPCNRTCAIPQP